MKKQNLISTPEKSGESLNPKESAGLEFAPNDDGSGYRVKSIGTCTDTEIVIPGSYAGKPVIGIGSYAFCGHPFLTHVTIPAGVTEIRFDAFHSCTSLTSITIPSGVTKISDGTLYGCTSLTDIKLPDGVFKIESFAFGRCTSLTSITIPLSVSEIQSYAFDHCTSLRSITFSGTKQAWKTVKREKYWKLGAPLKVVHCTDGDVRVWF